MKRLFWLGVGVAAGVTLTRKANEKAKAATPAGVAANLGDALRELGGAIGEFGAEVRAGMSEREEALHEEVERRSGVRAGGRHALGASTRPSTSRARARAHKADG